VLVAREECLAKRERVVLVSQRDLAHGRCLNRLAAVVANRLGHLDRSTALEAHHPQPAQPLRHVAQSTPLERFRDSDAESRAPSAVEAQLRERPRLVSTTMCIRCLLEEAVLRPDRLCGANRTPALFGLTMVHRGSTRRTFSPGPFESAGRGMNP